MTRNRSKTHTFSSGQGYRRCLTLSTPGPRSAEVKREPSSWAEGVKERTGEVRALRKVELQSLRLWQDMVQDVVRAAKEMVRKSAVAQPAENAL